MQREEDIQKNQQVQDKKLKKLAKETLQEIIDDIKNNNTISIEKNAKEFENDIK